MYKGLNFENTDEGLKWLETPPVELRGKFQKLIVRCRKKGINNFVPKKQYIAEAERFCKKGSYYTNYTILDENLKPIPFTDDMIGHVFQIVG